MGCSCTGSNGTKAKFGLRLVGVCWGAGIGDAGGVVSEEIMLEGDGVFRIAVFMPDVASVGIDGGCAGSAGVAVVSVGSDKSGVPLDAGVPDSEGSADGGRRGSSRIGTESRYGRISGSTADAESSRFFHFDGVSEGAVANRETGNAGLVDEDARGGEVERGIEVVENG